MDQFMVIGNNMMKQEEGYVSDMCNGAVSMEVRIQARNLLSRFEYLFFPRKKFGAFGWLSTQKCPSGPSMGP